MLLQGVPALQWSLFPICIPQFFLPIPFPCPIMVVLLPWFLLFLLDLSLVVPRKGSPETGPEIGLEVGPETTPTILPGDKVLDLLFPVVPFSGNTVLFHLLSSWANPSIYPFSNDPMNFTLRPRTSLQVSGGSPSNPLFKSNSTYPHIYSPMVTFNESSDNMRGMFSFVHSCQFFPGGNNKLLLSLLIKR